MSRWSHKVERASGCNLVVGSGSWPYAEANAAAIDALWAERLAANPRLFNGVIHLMEEYGLRNGAFEGRCLKTDFKSYVHWRQHGFADPSVADGFGSAIIRSADGAILLGRQREGNVNGGLAYPPGGFIDPRDVTADGVIDIEASIWRELYEETGLSPQTLTRGAGYYVTFMGPLVSLAAEFVSELEAEALRGEMLAFIARDPDPELDDVIIVASRSDLEGIAMPEYARVLLAHVFSGENAASAG